MRQSVAMELPVDQAKRQTIVKANLTLAEQSDAYYADLLGKKDFALYPPATQPVSCAA